MLTRIYDSPCGRLLLGVVGHRLYLCDWMVEGRIERSLRNIERNPDALISPDDGGILDESERQLREYFAGERQEFELPLGMGGTEFQNKVWQALREIAFGERASYKDVAAAIGSESSVRATANAIGANPLSIIVPCHRVVGIDGRLTGYAGGLGAKKYLLELERRVAQRSDHPQSPW